MKSKLSLRQSSSVKTSLKNRLVYKIVFAGGALTFLIFFLATTFHFFNPKVSYAASSGDYQTAGPGPANWNAAATWQKFNGANWVAASSPPSNLDGVITIRSGHTVTITSAATVDQVVVSSGGTVVLNSGISLTLANGAGNDFDVFGIFKNAGTIVSGLGVALVFENGGKYQHNYTTSAGIIPTATWSSGSTCEIIGYTTNTNPPGNLQTFHNFTWNCASQSAAINFKLTSWSINGNFSVLSTGSSQLIFNDNDFTLTSGGDYIQSGGTFILSNTNGRTGTYNIGGNYNQTGGTFSVVTGTGSIGTLKVTGNWTHTGGTLNVTGDAITNAQIVFRSVGSQTVTTGGNTVSGNVDYTVNSNATLIMGTSILTGRKFTLSNAAGLTMMDAGGISTSGTTGNIQTTGTRSFSMLANYTYNGSVAQIAGNGLPATVQNLTLNNSNDLTLTATVSVSNVLTLTSGNIITGSNEIRTTNTAAASIAGYSSSSYVIGNLRRTVAGTGTYDFPVGTSSNYELASLALTGATGFTTVLGTFTNANPLTPPLRLRRIYLNGFTINKMLDYGYWTFTPNTAMTGGTYAVTFKETGQSNGANYPSLYYVLKRANSAANWASIGTHNLNTQTESGGVVTAVRSGLTSFSDFAIAYGTGFIIFENDSLISGTDGSINATYLFPDVAEGLDAWIKIVSFSAGASLSDIDHFSAGYSESWQPYVIAAPTCTSSILWNIRFKKAGTASDTTLSNLTVTAVDVDGSPLVPGLGEFVEATSPTSYMVDPSTILTITSGGGYTKATSPQVGIVNIDTSQRQALFQLNYRNINNFNYRTGSNSDKTTPDIRQNSISFQSFFSTSTTLPVALISFAAKAENENTVVLNWVTAAERNNDYFTIERSEDGKQFSELSKISGSGNSSIVHEYSFTDENPLSGTSYYRLKQTDYNGKNETFRPVSVSNGSNQNPVDEVSVFPNPFKDFFNAKFELAEQEELELQLLNLNGTNVFTQKVNAKKGRNVFRFTPIENITPGLYIFRISNGKEVLSNLKVLCKK